MLLCSFVQLNPFPARPTQDARMISLCRPVFVCLPHGPYAAGISASNAAQSDGSYSGAIRRHLPQSLPKFSASPIYVCQRALELTVPRPFLPALPILVFTLKDVPPSAKIPCWSFSAKSVITQAFDTLFFEVFSKCEKSGPYQPALFLVLSRQRKRMHHNPAKTDHVPSAARSQHHIRICPGTVQ